MNRTSIINHYIKKIQAKSYLEIGVWDGNNFSKIKCDNKTGVDPDTNSSATVYLTSDMFFLHNQTYFDVIFIDGLHHADQVKTDILNSLNVLNPGGVIICHDMNPLTEDAQIIPFRGGMWNGDCWRAFVELRQTRSDLEMFTVDCDEGISIIKKGQQALLDIKCDVNYDNFSKNKKEWLNLISVNEFNGNIDPLAELLEKFVYNPANPENNLNLGLYYDNIGQTAAAISYYIRTAERTSDDLVKYQCLLRTALCFEKQGSRAFSVKGMLQHAVALLPKRPEAYFLLSKFHENEKKEGDWFLCYMLSSIGLELCDFNLPKLEMNINYPGRAGLLFEKAVSSWWCGLCEESKSLFKELLENYELDSMHETAVINNLQMLDPSYIPVKKIKHNTPVKSNDTKIKLDYTTGKLKIKEHNDTSLINPNYQNGIWIIDNFYNDPDSIREFALKQDYHQGGIGRGYIGRRTFQQFLFPGLKEEFEKIMGRKIVKWEEHGMNGRFQYNSEGAPLVYHCDDQQWAGMLYLTPDAPPDTGTSTYALKGTDIRHKSHPDIMKCFRPGSQNLDRTLFEAVDNIGNVYNRLVIFNAGYLHAASGYFGFTPENSRLWQMFFFD